MSRLTQRLSTHFGRWEFQCQGRNCCDQTGVADPRLIMLLQAIRDRVGLPVTVSSGFRCRRHNSATPDATPNSYHTIGWAADIYCRDLPVEALHGYVEEVIAEHGFGYAILYPHRGFVHIDIRDFQT